VVFPDTLSPPPHISQNRFFPLGLPPPICFFLFFFFLLAPRPDLKCGGRPFPAVSFPHPMRPRLFPSHLLFFPPWSPASPSFCLASGSRLVYSFSVVPPMCVFSTFDPFRAQVALSHLFYSPPDPFLSKEALLSVAFLEPFLPEGDAVRTVPEPLFRHFVIVLT